MPSVENPPVACCQVPEASPISSRLPAHPLRHILRQFLAGLNRLLELSDFARGDWFRN
jgi:hypothetical protein